MTGTVAITIDDIFKSLIPPLRDQELQLLEESIGSDGCREPVICWLKPDGERVLVDGHNRYSICEKLDLPYDIEDRQFADRDEVEDWIDRNQLGRRNLRPDDFVMLVGRRYNRAKKRHGSEPGTNRRDGIANRQSDDLQKTSKSIASDHGVSPRTVERAGELVDYVAEAEKADPELVKKTNAEKIKAAKELKKKKAAERKAKREQQKREAVTQNHPLSGAMYKLIHGDLADVADQIEEDSVDAIITDPPYPAEFLPVYTKLVDLAERVLRPGGHLLAMVGQANLPHVIERMEDSSLVYQWTLGYFTPGQSTQVFGRRIKSNWKPILYYVKGKTDWEHVDDVIKSDMNDKRFHEWGQSVGGSIHLIERFTSRSSLVLDPFVGGGTTGVACLATGRLFIGIDVDNSCIQETAKRLNDIQSKLCVGIDK